MRIGYSVKDEIKTTGYGAHLRGLARENHVIGTKAASFTFLARSTSEQRNLNAYVPSRRVPGSALKHTGG